MRIYKYLIIFLFLFLIPPNNALSCACSGKTSVQVAACTNSEYGNSTCTTSASVYKMTVTSGEFYNSTTGERWELKSGNATYDIASQKFDYVPAVTNVKPGTYDQFRGYADNVFTVKGYFTTTDSKSCVTYGDMDSTYGDFRDSGIGTLGNLTEGTLTTKNFGSSTYATTDPNGNLVELIDSSGNRSTSDSATDRIRVVYNLPSKLTLVESDKIQVKMFLTPRTAIRATFATSDGAGKYNCTAVGMRAPIFTMTVTRTPMQ